MICGITKVYQRRILFVISTNGEVDDWNSSQKKEWSVIAAGA